MRKNKKKKKKRRQKNVKKKKDKSSRGLAFKSLKECDPHRRGCTWSDLGDVGALGRTSTPPHPPHSHGNPIDAFFVFVSLHLFTLTLFSCRLHVSCASWNGKEADRHGYFILKLGSIIFFFFFYGYNLRTHAVWLVDLFSLCACVCVCEHDSPSLPPSLPVTQWLTCTDVSTNEIPPPLSLSLVVGEKLFIP